MANAVVVTVKTRYVQNTKWNMIILNASIFKIFQTFITKVA